MRSNVCLLLLSALLAGALAGCGDDGSSARLPLTPGPGAGVPAFPSSPDGFMPDVTHALMGFRPGRVFSYEGRTEHCVQTIVVQVLRSRTTILGVTTTVVRDREYLDGNLVEDTIDWYAQDRRGNVWYFGEDAKQMDHGRIVGTEGSWRAGVRGARPGLVMLAAPRIGDQYQQEFAEGIAEDRAQVVSLTSTVHVPFGTFTNCLKTKEWSPLSRGTEYKYYAPGVGLVLEKEGDTRIELVAVN